MRAPVFWKDHNFISSALRPVAALYRYVGLRRAARVTPVKLQVPIICVGNVVAGGAGKTPVALAIGSMLKAQGVAAHFLTRGYGGRLEGPVQVNPRVHTARDVGDEALLLAERLPTWVARDRAAGGRAAMQAGAEFIVMDDGYQNPSLHKDIQLLVIDGHYGVGNGRLIPAGPLREKLPDAVARATAVILYGEDRQGILKEISPYLPVLAVALKPMPSAMFLKDKPVMAFAGIARPRKFYRTLKEMGCEVRHMASFADHHNFSAPEVEALLAKAREMDCILVTTTKDYVRLNARQRVNIFPVQVEAVFAEPDALWRLVFP